MPTITSKRAQRLVQRIGLSFRWVIDLRANRGRQSSLPSLLRLMLVGLCSGLRQLRQIEQLSRQLPARMRRRLGLRGRRISDTTLYEMLQRRTVSELGFREALQEQLRADLDAKRIENDFFAGGVASYDGKSASWGMGERPNSFCQTHFFKGGSEPSWRLMTLRSCLTSSSARPVLNQTFLRSNGEATTFPRLFAQDVKCFPRLFRYVTADAGITSTANAQVVIEAGKHYLFALKGNHQRLFANALEALEGIECCFSSTERYRGKWQIRELRSAVVPSDEPFFGAKQFVSVTSKHIDDHGRKHVETRLFVTSIEATQIATKRLLELVRLHWGIENGPNWTCDVVLREDSHCPCRTGNGLTTMSWLNILAYNILAVFRSRLPGRERKRPPWKEVLWLFFSVFIDRPHLGAAGIN